MDPDSALRQCPHAVADQVQKELPFGRRGLCAAVVVGGDVPHVDARAGLIAPEGRNVEDDLDSPFVGE